jgi:DNA-binding response OmpR family regulator
MQRPRILITDGDRDTRAIFGTMLRHAGFEVEEACDGDEALPGLLARPPAVLIVAVELAPNGGIEVLHCVRNCSAAHDTKVIAVTSHVLPHERRIVEAAGFDGILYRPVSPPTVLRVVRHVMSRAA